MEDVQNKFSDSQFKARTAESHNEYLSQLDGSKHINGIKSKSCFIDSLKFFNISDGLPPDIMHDFLEGVIPANFKLLIDYLSKQKICNISELNKKLNNFKYKRIDGQTKVINDYINETLKKKNGYTKMKATTTWTLIKVFPIICGDLLANDRYYQHFCKIIEIFRALNDHSYDNNKITNIEEKIENYLQDLKILYPDKTLTAKHHFLIHYGGAIRSYGPPILYLTMRFEAKHSFFKKVYIVTHNSKNVTKSLVERNQENQLYFLESCSYIKHTKYGATSINEEIKIKANTFFKNNSHSFHRSVEFKGISYSLKDIVVISKRNNMPEFGIINAIINPCDKSPYFLVKKIETLSYISHFTGYLVLTDNDDVEEFINLEKIFHPFPLDLYEYKKELNIYLIIPKYQLEI